MGSAGADAMELPSRTPWWPRALGVVVVLLLFVLAAWWLHGLIGRPSEPKRQVSKISILPDTPPPPPPPKEEKRPDPPKIEPKQLAREEQAKPDVPKPVNQPIKMEGTAGNGDSPFTSGSVSQDYRGGVPVTGASSPATFADRTQERFYANSARQLLHDEIEHHLQSETGEVVATFSLWIEPDGRIRKIELLPGSDVAVDTDLRAALDETSRSLRLPQPGNVQQPLRFRMTMRRAS